MSTHSFEEQSESSYALVVVSGAIETTHEVRLSHPAAMVLAERLQHEGKIVRVMHVTATGSYEVDRYPLR
jgi:hypothetical protein